MKKNIVALPLCLCALSFAFSQENDSEKIILPEITSSVEGGAVVAGKDSAPDFSDSYPMKKDDEFLPKLSGIDFSSAHEELEADLSSYGDDKNLFAEGTVSGGYPGDFSGIFSVSQNSGNDPFSIYFMHSSRNGFGYHTVSHGYFENDTFVELSKSFSCYGLDFNVRGAYERNGVGFQEKSEYFHDVTMQGALASVQAEKRFGKGFCFGTSFDGDWHNRFAGVKTDGEFSVQEVNANILSFKPKVFLSWEKEALKVFCEGDVMWNFFAEHEDDIYDERNSSSLIRGDAIAGFQWTSEKFHAGAKGGIVWGSETGTACHILPDVEGFAGFSAVIPSTGKSFSLEAKGGIESYLPTAKSLEKEYRFASLLSLPGESTDAFGILSFILPVTNSVSLDASGEFRATFLGNGIWEAQYDKKFSSGAYRFFENDRESLNVNAGITFYKNDFAFRTGWDGYFLDVPTNKYSQNLFGTFTYSSEASKWGFYAGVFESLSNGADMVPVVDGSVSYRVRKSISLALSVSDLIKLVSCTDRSYMDTEYLVRAGNVSLSASFYF